MNRLQLGVLILIGLGAAFVYAQCSTEGDGPRPGVSPPSAPEPIQVRTPLEDDGMRSVAEAGSEARVRPDPTDGSALHPPSREWPEGYTGVRDQNMVLIYRAMEQAIETQAKMLANPTADDARLLAPKLNYLTSAAYVSLIQGQRHYYYGYDKRGYQRPPNTKDREYHVTGMGEMVVVFELTRTEFPQLFELKDALAQVQGSQQGR